MVRGDQFLWWQYYCCTNQVAVTITATSRLPCFRRTVWRCYFSSQKYKIFSSWVCIPD